MKSRALTVAGVLLLSALHAGAAHAGALTPSPTSLMFPDTGTGSTSASKTVMLTNTSMAMINVSSVTLVGTNPGDFVFVDPGVPVGLGPGVSIPVEVSFAPTVGGARSATLAVQVAGEASTTNVTLTGNGVGPKISVSPSPLMIGGVLFGQPVAPILITVSNAGGSKVEVSNVTISGPDAAKFSLQGLPSLPLAQPLGPSQSFQVQLTYTPTGPGAAMAVLEVLSDDPTTPDLMTAITGLSGDPAIALDLGTILFGNQRIGQPSATQDVNIENNGYSDLHVQSITLVGANPSDFQLTALPNLPATVPVGQTVKFTVLFDPTMTGARSASVQVASDDPVAATKSVAMSGVGTTPAAMVSPPSIDFGAVAVGGSGGQSISIKNSGTGPVQVTTLALGGPDAASFSLGVSAPFTVAPGASTLVKVTFKPTKVATFSASVSLTTDDPNLPMATVALTGSSTAPGFSVSPGTLDFGQVPVGTTSAPQSFTIQNSGNQDLTVTGFDLVGGGLGAFTVTLANGAALPSTPFTVPKGGMTSFSVVYNPTTTDGDDAGITITTDDPANPTADVELLGTGAEAAISTEPPDQDTLDFGSIVVGATSSKLGIKIDNTGTAPLVIQQLLLSGMATAFSVDTTAPFTIAVNSSQTLELTFTPKLAQAYAAAIEIDSADTNLSPVTIMLTGTGVAPMLGVATNTADNVIDFGDVVMGTASKPAPIIIHNSATMAQPLMVASDTPEFTVDQASVMVASGVSVTVNVTFKPDALTAYSGHVNLTLPGVTTPFATVTVKGQGSAKMGAGTTRSNGGCAVGGRAPANVMWVLGLVALGLVVRRRRR